MSRYFTSDFHLGSLNILKHANRPFSSAKEAMTSLLINVNSNLKRYDTLIHVGDFMLSGVDRHDNVEDSGLKYKIDDYLDMFEPNLILLAGNHDDGRNCETVGKSMVIDLNQNYRNVYVSHFPSYHKDYYGPFGNSQKAPRIALCGHVHDKWLLKYNRENHVLNVNVGVDVWNYKPVRDSEITKILDFIFDTSGPNRTYFDRSWTWARKDLEHFQACQKHDREQLREIRKKERHARKGLTPEECERRKQAALAAKRAR